MWARARYPPLSAGPVSIDPATMTLTIASLPAMVQEKFLAVHTVERVIETTYYDPLDAHDVKFETVDHAEGLDGDWLVVQHGLRLRLTGCEVPSCALLEVDATRVENATQVLLALPREKREPLYGSGDAGERADLTGTRRDLSIRNEPRSDSGLNESHVPVPLVLWPRRGAGMLVADDRPGALDLATTFDTRVTATFNLPERGVFQVYLFTAAAPLDLVRAYARLTAMPAVPPRWALAPQHGRAWSSSAELLADTARMRAERMPGSAILLYRP